MKITLYDLLGMIKDGKAPKKIEFDTEKYLWCEKQEEYRRYPYENNLYYNLWSDYDLTKCLNEEVKILETLEEEKKLPEKLIPTSLKGIDNLDEKIEIAHIDTISVIDTVNEILDYLESKGE